jgi:predicted DNA-binding transcriptional regulator YafY
MATKALPAPNAEQTAVTVERAARLYRLLHLLAESAPNRATLMRRLKLDVRGFYRDLELLRASGIVVEVQSRRYRLVSSIDEALSRLPLPDPRLTLGECLVLARGRNPAHRKLREHLDRIMGANPASRRA